MGKRVLVICSSPRRNGNSEILADEFIRGAAEAGHQTEKIRLAEQHIGYCRACYYCETNKACVQQDGVNELLAKLQQADTVVFATPIYFFEMSGQLKVFLDRTMPLYFLSYHFRDVYLLASAAEDVDSAMDGAVKGIEGWIDCYEGSRLAGVVRGHGADRPGTVRATGAAEEAYRLGLQS